MDDLARMIREIFDLRDIPVVTQAFIRALADDGARIIHEEARRTKRRLGPE